ncbi:MAG: Rieske (2Fe-2S) protein [Lacibacter sp.]
MKEKTYKWVKVAESVQELNSQSNHLSELTVEGKTICIAHYGGQLHGCASKCPHAGGRMADGFIDAAGNIVCPLHRYKFQLTTGRNTSGEGYYLKTYPVEVREDGVYVGLEEKGLFNWLG